MKKILFFFFLIPTYIFSQSLDSLTVEKIMRDPKWIGTSPSGVFWSSDSQKIYFDWNPEQMDGDSLYSVSLQNHTPKKISIPETQLLKAEHYSGVWNNDYSKRAFINETSLYIRELGKAQAKPVIQTTQRITQPQFIANGAQIAYRQANNLYAVNLEGGGLTQLTNFQSGTAEEDTTLTAEEKFLKEDALENSVILKERTEREEKRKQLKKLTQSLPQPIYLEGQNLVNLSISPDAQVVFYQLSRGKQAPNTEVPNYVTLSGHTENLNARPKVGTPDNQYSSFLLNRSTNKSIPIEIEEIPGIKDIPAFYKEYPEKYAALQKDPPLRQVSISSPIWNKTGSAAFVVINAMDHKDRWIMALDPQTGKLELLDRQHDDAWIGGPGIVGYASYPGNVGWIDEGTLWFQSEETGYSHLYSMDIKSKKKTALTKGDFEVQDAQLSQDHKTFFITTNQVSPGETNFYQLNLKNNKITRITQGEGGYKTTVSPDGKQLAVLHSTSNHPWELYLQENKSGAKAVQLTDKAESNEFKSYAWRKPEIFTFTNRDGDQVYAEVYKPEKQAESRPGAIFVHGAGYLQDVKNSWSDSYFREHLFMNLLADHGYTVLNIDYRASAGYGRDWRTAIYRHMGKNDLNDNVDGAKYMVDHFNVNPDKIGIWGGSYGGFTTLMALFTTDTFAAGAALRSVTDWAHYNHGYTSNILNLPQNDPIAYKQSSPIYFAEGLKGHLLMPHGMVDTNVHFQDIVRLTQKLIELGKENWELAVYPMENHGFVEPSSWTDEYKRIFKLFEENLK